MNDWRHMIRNKRALGIFLLCCLVAAAALGGYYCQKGKGKFAGAGNEKNALDYRPDYRMRIERLQFYGMKDGQRVIAIIGDSFVIEKKKIGFLTISVAHVARLDNARLDLYDSRPATAAGGGPGDAGGKKNAAYQATGSSGEFTTPGGEKDGSGRAATDAVATENAPGTMPDHDGRLYPGAIPGRQTAAKTADTTAATEATGEGAGKAPKKSSPATPSPSLSPLSPLSPLTPRPSYGAVFSAEAFQDFPVPISSISAIEVAPITVRLFNGYIQTSQLTASRAELRFKHRDILCEGDVRIVSGGRELRTESLVFQPETGLIQTKHPYALTTAGKVKTGGRITTDVYLRPQSTR